MLTLISNPIAKLFFLARSNCPSYKYGVNILNIFGFMYCFLVYISANYTSYFTTASPLELMFCWYSPWLPKTFSESVSNISYPVSMIYIHQHSNTLHLRNSLNYSSCKTRKSSKMGGLPNFEIDLQYTTKTKMHGIKIKVL